MAEFGDFSARMRVRAKAVSENSDRLVRKVALSVDQALVSGTPVDTGRARSNWIVQLDAASDQTIEAYAPGSGASTVSDNTQAALAQGSREIAGYSGDHHSEIHITNNLPYIEQLNDGWSHQAPANFVQEAIALVAEAFHGVVLSSPGGVK